MNTTTIRLLEFDSLITVLWHLFMFFRVNPNLGVLLLRTAQRVEPVAGPLLQISQENEFGVAY